MTDAPGNRPTLLSLEGSNARSETIRAKALVFVDPVSRGLLRYLERVAPSEAPVLIIGETGTGKELVARHVHQLSARRGPFVAVNCGAISENLAESELFGHESGAFTGATGRREGWFEAANGGTLFLDEIGDLPLSLQVKLLRVLQEREVVRIGSRKPIPVDIRLVAATNIDLGEAVRAWRFRLDLYYRLNIAQLTLPPLRERRGDILPLVHHFLGHYRERLGLLPQIFSNAALRALESYNWPGNIRELENVVHFALLVASDHEIGPEHLKLTDKATRPQLGGGVTHSAGTPRERVQDALQERFNEGGDGLFDEYEKLIIEEAFRYSNYNQVRAAALLGLSRNVLRTLLRKHGYLSERGQGVGNGVRATGALP